MIECVHITIDVEYLGISLINQLIKLMRNVRIKLVSQYYIRIYFIILKAGFVIQKNIMIMYQI